MVLSDPLEIHALAAAEFDRRVRMIADDQWSAPTPCTEWDVRALVNHLVNEQLWVSPLIGGKTINEVGDQFDGDQLRDDPRAAWADSAREARAAIEEPGAIERTVHLSYGEVPAAEYINDLATDLAVHAWDLARGIGADDTIDPRLVATIDERSRPLFAGQQGSSLFDAPVDVAEDEPAQVRLLALFGRDAR